jgi:hypothetical protein
LKGWLPICPICGQPIETPDMHEVILTRGDVQYNDAVFRLLIYVPENCVLLHPGKCHHEAATKAGQMKCILQLLESETYDGIMAWLESIKAQGKGAALYDEAMRKVNMVMEVERDSLVCESGLPIRESGSRDGPARETAAAAVQGLL